MENKEVIRVGEDIRYFVSCDTRQKGGQQRKWLQALDHLISLAKDYEQAKAGLPKGISCKDVQCHPPVCEGCQKECKDEYIERHQVALGLVKFKKRLEEIIDTWDWNTSTKQAKIKTIMKEMGGE